ncbi:MAG: hypothetical protein LBR26_13905 [Prevotella sp.]|jgi:hypothetical protein|nr:hypothetical protein [Prevotella sp.]
MKTLLHVVTGSVIIMMKTKNLIFTVGMLFTLLSSNLVAQNDKIEKTVNGETYVIEGNVRIKNKHNKQFRGNTCEYFYIEDGNSLDCAFKKTFSKNRLDELAQIDASLGLIILCDASGKVEEVSFFRKGIDVFSLTEIQILEKNIIGLNIKIKSPCPDINEYWAVKYCRFKKRFWDK